MIIERFGFVDSTLFMFLYLFFHQLSLSGETELLQYAEYFKSTTWVKTLVSMVASLICRAVSETAVVCYQYETREPGTVNSVCLFICLDLCNGIRCCQWTSSCFDRLLCGPESCKTESYSFLTGVSITLSVTCILTLTMSCRHIKLKRPWLCHRKH